MEHYQISWQAEPDEILDAVPVRQVYVWIIASDNYVVTVSKDGKDWQLPGGKPDPDESVEQTAVREVAEETGLDISGNIGDAEFLGQQIVTDLRADETYRQIRLLIRLSVESTNLNLSPEHESADQSAEDVVRFCQAVPLLEIPSHIPWMNGSDEYNAVLAS